MLSPFTASRCSMRLLCHQNEELQWISTGNHSPLSLSESFPACATLSTAWISESQAASYQLYTMFQSHRRFGSCRSFKRLENPKKKSLSFRSMCAFPARQRPGPISLVACRDQDPGASCGAETTFRSDGILCFFLFHVAVWRCDAS